MPLPFTLFYKFYDDCAVLLHLIVDSKGNYSRPTLDSIFEPRRNFPPFDLAMAPSALVQRRTHNLLLFQKLLNLRDGASPFTLLLDTVDQSAKPVVKEFMTRAKAGFFILTSSLHDSSAFSEINPISLSLILHSTHYISFHCVTNSSLLTFPRFQSQT